MNKVIYCDGACKGNPGPSGAGVVIIENNKPIMKWIGAYQENGTNNIAELKAMQMALFLAKKLNIKTIKTDSQYTINILTKWAISWQKNNWKKKGGPIKNLKLIKELYKEYQNLDVTLKYVKGHSNNKGNDLADYLANQAIAKKAKKWTKQ